jgi:hypothetical protein
MSMEMRGLEKGWGRTGRTEVFQKSLIVAAEGPGAVNGAVNGGQNSRKQDHGDEGETDEKSNHLKPPLKQN